MQPFRLDGLSALVTGSGRGMGREVALALASLGAVVAVADIDHDNAASVRDEIQSAGGTAQCFGVDIAQVSSIRTLFADFDRSPQASLDILVLAAGVIRPKPFFEHDESDWDFVTDVNVKGTFFCLQEGARRMVPRRKGKIVTFSSTSGFVASRIPEIADDISKGAIRQMTISAAIELADAGLNVNAVAPGTILTDFNRATLDTPEKVGVAESHLPMGRIGTPDDVVGAVVFLCSSLADYITGHVLVVDGGRLGRAG
jgi:NAD(P)-dependent dehydrogenase (short-subunit alcohol dehydrogenase family)